MDSREIIKRFEALESRRQPWESLWQQCSDHVLPRSGRNGRQSLIFDSTAPLALGRFASALESMLTPRTQKWHGLVTGDPAADHNPEVARWCEALRDLMFCLRYAPEANFANQMMEAYLSLGVHGTAVIFVDEALGVGLRYKCIPIHECYLAVDAAGRVDTVFRLYRLSARQAVSEFGENLPEQILKDAADPGRMDEKHEFIHGVFPRGEISAGRRDPLNMPLASVHVARSSARLVRESGYRTMPYAVSRFYVEPGGIYGRSPAMDAMPDIVMVNAMNKTLIRAAEKMVNPPLLVPEDDVLSAFSLKAGSINYGGLDDQGRQRVAPLQVGGNLPIGLEMINRSREVINEAFFLNLFQVLLEKSGQQTATEVVERAKEKAQLLAPTMGRQQAELLRAVIERELDIIINAGGLNLLPPVPGGLPLVGGRLQPQYTTEMAQAMASFDSQAVMQSIQALGLLAQVDPGVMDIIDFDAAGRVVIASSGVPSIMVRGEEEVKQIRQQREAAQAQMAQAQMMSQGLAEAGTLMDVAGKNAEIEQMMSDSIAAGRQ